MAEENVNHPAHYGGEDNPYEVIKVLENWLTPEEFIGALKFNVFKYNARARLKGGAESYAKAQFYQNYLVDFMHRKGLTGDDERGAAGVARLDRERHDSGQRRQGDSRRRVAPAEPGYPG